jgi:hypothetical protein
LIAALLLFTLAATSERLAQFIAGLPIWPKRFALGERLLRFSQSLRLYRSHGPAVAYALFWSFVFQGAIYMSYWVLAKGLGLPAPVWAFFAFIPLITIVTMIPASLNGIGAREMAHVFFFTQVGLDPGQAVALSVGCFAFLAAVSLLGGVVYAVQKRTT